MGSPDNDQSTTIHSLACDGDGDAVAFEHMLAGRYKVLGLLGKGGMGTVYRANQVFLNQELALKILDSHKVSDSIQVRRFQQEAKAEWSLSHPNLVQVHDFGILENGQPYLVMDIVQGITLAEWMEKHGTISLQDVAPIFSQVCAGLAYAHQQKLVHRDIKPSNLMLVEGTAHGSEGSVKIVDFGIAKLTREEGSQVQTLTKTGEIVGSPLYMSPEQCSGDRVDYRSDIYSLGCVLFEALTGTPPHMGANAFRTMTLHQSEPAPLLREASLGKEFPQALEQIVDKMLAKKPADRYQDLALVAHDLAVACAGHSSPLIEQPQKPRKQLKEKRIFSFSPVQLACCFAAIVLSTAAATALVIGYLKPGSTANLSASERKQQNKLNSSLKPQQSPESTNFDDLSKKMLKADQSDIDLSKVAFEQAVPITSSIVVKNHTKYRRFQFPNSPLGTVSNAWYIASGNTATHFEDEAVKTIDFPCDVPLSLRVDGQHYPAPLDSPSIFAKIGRDEFASLDLANPPNDQVLKEDNNEPSLEDNVATILNTASGWSNLESVLVHGLRLNSAAISALNKMPHLRDLQLNATNVKAAEIVEKPFLDRLTGLALGAEPAVNEILHHVSKSKTLNRLKLEECRHILPETLEELGQCSHLEFLQLKQATIGDQSVKAITHLKSLTGIKFVDTSLTPEQIKVLQGCSWIKSIELPLASADSLMALHTTDPRIHIVGR